MNLLWDLDGTLTDPQDGIIRCIQFALEQCGLPVPAHEELLWTIGPPLHESFAKLAPETDPAALVAKYRERFGPTGLFENSVFWGIPDLLSKLGGFRHFLATSKPHVFASQILDHFKLTPHFTRIYGSELDGTRSDKGELIAYLLAQEALTPANALMIGDRRHDIAGAKKNGLAALGVLWGYGSREELQGAGANLLFETPVELRDYLLGLN
ncbi:MAG: HAD-IA family hydrolase [Bdellovibrionota bacterium]